MATTIKTTNTTSKTSETVMIVPKDNDGTVLRHINTVVGSVPIEADISDILDNLAALSGGVFTDGDAIRGFLVDHPSVTIAGGSMLDAVSTHPTRGHGSGDIDFWVSTSLDSEDHSDKVLTNLIDLCTRPARDVLIGRVGAVVTILPANSDTSIQIIRLGNLSPVDIIKQFDMSPVQVGVNAEANGEIDVFYTPEFLNTLETGMVLHIANDARHRPIRMRKYQDRGFTMPDSVIVPDVDDEAVVRDALRQMMFMPAADNNRKSRARAEFLMRNSCLEEAVYFDPRCDRSDKYQSIQNAWHATTLKLNRICDDGYGDEDLTKEIVPVKLASGMCLVRLGRYQINTGCSVKWYCRGGDIVDADGNEILPAEGVPIAKVRLLLNVDKSLPLCWKDLADINSQLCKDLKLVYGKTMLNKRTPTWDQQHAELIGNLNGKASITIPSGRRCKVIDAVSRVERGPLTVADMGHSLSVQGTLVIYFGPVGLMPVIEARKVTVHDAV